MAGPGIAPFGLSGLQIALWAALGLCVAVLVGLWDSSAEFIVSIGVAGWFICSALLLSTWFLAVAAWRALVRAHDPAGVGWGASARQVGLLLCGKYLPGGIWGFLARQKDAVADVPALKAAVAGVSEQWLNFAALLQLGLLCYAVPWIGSLAVLLVLPIVPIASMVALGSIRWCVEQLAGSAPQSWRITRLAMSGTAAPERSLLAAASLLSALQQLACVAMVALLSQFAFQVPIVDAIAIGGAYALGITLGMAALFAPGGVAVREAGFVVLATQWLSPQSAIALAAVLRLLFALLDVCAGLFAAIVGRQRVRQ